MVKFFVNKLKNHFKNLAFKLNDKTKKVINLKKKKQKKPIKSDKPVFQTLRNLDGCKNNFVTYQIQSDLFTLLYSSLVFQWIESERLVIIVDQVKIGYQLELFLRSFKFNATYLDPEMPLNTNKHFYNQFLKGTCPIMICSPKYNDHSEQYGELIVDSSPIPVTIIYFNTIDENLLNFHYFNANTKSIYHFISNNLKDNFFVSCEKLPPEISFSEYNFNLDQMIHLRYRCEDILHSITKNDIKKAKTKKLSQELLYSKKMESYFKSNPEEKNLVIKTIQDCNINTNRPSVTYLPSYIIHDESKKNLIEEAINKKYNKQITENKKKNRPSKMEKYLNRLDKEKEASLIQPKEKEQTLVENVDSNQPKN